MLHTAVDIVVTFFMVHLPAVIFKSEVGIVWNLGFRSLFRTYSDWRNICTSIDLQSTTAGFFLNESLST
jgi:hypothetical protein